MGLLKYQVGASVTGVMMLVLLVGGGLTVGMKLVPLYMDHSTIETLLDKLATEDGMADKRKGELVSLLENRLKLNQIRDFPLQENLEIEKTRNGTELKLNYEVRLPLVGNVDMIASFSKEIELRN